MTQKEELRRTGIDRGRGEEMIEKGLDEREFPFLRTVENMN